MVGRRRRNAEQAAGPRGAGPLAERQRVGRQIVGAGDRDQLAAGEALDDPAVEQEPVPARGLGGAGGEVDRLDGPGRRELDQLAAFGLHHRGDLVEGASQRQHDVLEIVQPGQLAGQHHRQLRDLLDLGLGMGPRW